MRLLTLTPELEAYVVALVSVAGLSCAPAAALISIVWRPLRAAGFLAVYAGLMGAVVVLGLVTLTLPSFTQSSSPALVASVALAVPAGFGASACDTSIRRSLRRRARRRRSERGVRVRRPVPGAASVVVGGSLTLLLVVAALEELVFRGVLVDLALQLSLLAAVACIAATVVVFAAAHVYWGLEEFVAKLPLGVAALAVSLPFRAVVGAVVAHMVFNARYWFVSSAA